MSFVYFIQCQSAVKIGTATDLRRRLNSIQNCNPTVLTLRCFLAGGHAMEASCHAHWAESQIRGEWFHAHDGHLADFMDACFELQLEMVGRDHPLALELAGDGEIPMHWIPIFERHGVVDVGLLNLQTMAQPSRTPQVLVSSYAAGEVSLLPSHKRLSRLSTEAPWLTE
jgi:Meiotically up-regulated gene 113